MTSSPQTFNLTFIYSIIQFLIKISIPLALLMIFHFLFFFCLVVLTYFFHAFCSVSLSASLITVFRRYSGMHPNRRNYPDLAVKWEWDALLRSICSRSCCRLWHSCTWFSFRCCRLKQVHAWLQTIEVFHQGDLSMRIFRLYGQILKDYQVTPTVCDSLQLGPKPFEFIK